MNSREARIKELDTTLASRAENILDINRLKQELVASKKRVKELEGALEGIRANYWPSKAAKDAQNALNK